VLIALSHLCAAWLAARIGLLNTMVFTHTPSSLILLTVAFAPSFETAAALYLLREGLVEMDVPTRTSYVMAIVAPEERTRVSAVTNLVRIAAWGVAAEISGRLMKGASLVVPLAVAAAIKITYDALLYFSFRRIHPPEERPTP
jgi:predicted MFS family arabinose efflux permease